MFFYQVRRWMRVRYHISFTHASKYPTRRRLIPLPVRRAAGVNDHYAREPTERDVQIEILFCGICHSDLHIARNEWGEFIHNLPVLPGHEIVGRVVKVGKAVKKFKEGDLVAVGCMVDSDRTCANCKAGLEQFCESGATFTYNGKTSTPVA